MKLSQLRFILAFFSVLFLANLSLAQQMDLSETSEAIQKGKIDVGKQYTMHKKKGRYHIIHSDKVGMECEACHVGKKYAPDYILLSKEQEEKRAAGKGKGPDADVVDRSVCLGCHKTNGVATAWYRTADK